MTQSQPNLTPYDTGARCEPKLWQPDRASVLAAMSGDEGQDIGNVDFDDDEGHTVATVHVSRTSDGVFTVHVVPSSMSRSWRSSSTASLSCDDSSSPTATRSL